MASEIMRKSVTIPRHRTNYPLIGRQCISCDWHMRVDKKGLIAIGRLRRGMISVSTILYYVAIWTHIYKLQINSPYVCLRLNISSNLFRNDRYSTPLKSAFPLQGLKSIDSISICLSIEGGFEEVDNLLRFVIFFLQFLVMAATL